MGKIKELYLHWQETVASKKPTMVLESDNQMAFWHWVHNEADKEGFLAEKVREIDLTQEDLDQEVENIKNMEALTVKFNTDGEVMHDKKLRDRVEKLEGMVYELKGNINYMWDKWNA